MRDDVTQPGPTQLALPLDARAVLESMGDAFYALDAEWRFIYANTRALRFWGLGADRLLGLAIWDVFPAMRGTRNEAALREAMERRSTVSFEGRSPTTGVMVSVTVLPAGDGVAVYWRDISERVEAERRLRDSEEHLRLAQEAGGIGTWEWNLQTRIVRGSGQMFRLLGHEPDDRSDLLDAFLAVLHPEDRAGWEAAFRGFRAREGPLRHECRIMLPTGEIRWLVFLGRVEADPAGQPVRMLGIAIDGTSRRRTEEALRESAERLRLAMSAGGFATWEYDVATGRREWSPEAAEMHGFPPELRAMSRQEWAARIHPEDRPLVRDAFDAALQERRDYACEYRVRLPSGGVRWTAAWGSVLRDPSGAPVRVVGVLQDVTERRRNEERLRQLNRELEERVQAEMTAREAAQARAAQAERLQALGQLAGGIAHDFNNVLQTIQGAAALIERRPDSPDAIRRYARMVTDAAARGASVTGRLLAFGRRGDLRAEPVTPQALLDGLRDILTHALGSSLDVGIQADPGLPPMLVDRGQLETVLVNLATNARDAMPDGGTLTVSAAAETVADASSHPAGLSAGTYIRLDVADTGTGMDKATLARASEPFFTTKPVGKGTGLGLAMARGFAEQSGGRLSIQSEPGRGTVVSLWFPLAQKGAEARSAPAGSEGAGCVLLADDDDLVREVLGHELEEAGFTVLRAGEATQALDLLASGAAIDALVTDLSMPDLDGLELIREARQMRPGLPAILLTGYAREIAERPGGRQLAEDFVLMRKPADSASIAARLVALLHGHAAGG